MEDHKRMEIMRPLIAGGVAGLSVDVALYPLDTLKTRLQSAQGFQKAGGFSGVYKGLSAVMAGSMPSSALFFLSYEASKIKLLPLVGEQYAPAVYMIAACFGEVLACVFRVPMEIAKQRKQTHTGPGKITGLGILFDAYRKEGIRRGVYRGFLSTVMRDVPFSLVELPLWELLKSSVKNRNDGQITNVQSAFCGSVAGGFAAAVSTPLDMAKTRIMLAKASSSPEQLRVLPVLGLIFREAGLRGLFAGAVPRTTAFTIGGFVYFGAYDYAKNLCDIVC